MQSVDIFDTVKIQRADEVSVFCTDNTISGRENLAFNAAELFFETAGLHGGALIEIEKNIPKAAGLAGGSADAAAVITGLNAIYKTGFDLKKLCEIGVKAGADVPFCIVGGTKLAEGIGEKLSELTKMPDCTIVIAKKGEKSSTGALYAQFDKFGAQKRPRTESMISALEAGNVLKIGENLCNVFEGLIPKSEELKKLMLQSGAVGSALSGSGPTVFGVFDNAEKAESCRRLIGSTAKICSPAKSGCEFI